MTKKERKRILNEIQEYWDDETGAIDAVYLLEYIEAVLKEDKE